MFLMHTICNYKVNTVNDKYSIAFYIKPKYSFLDYHTVHGMFGIGYLASKQNHTNIVAVRGNSYGPLSGQSFYNEFDVSYLNYRL